VVVQYSYVRSALNNAPGRTTTTLGLRDEGFAGWGFMVAWRACRDWRGREAKPNPLREREGGSGCSGFLSLNLFSPGGEVK